MNPLKWLTDFDWRQPPPAPLREAAGVSVDPDDGQWRRLTGDGTRDLSPMTHSRMQQTAAYLWQANPVANRLVELPIAFLLADGVSLVSKAEDPDLRLIVQETLDRFWLHPINNFPIKLPKKVRELALFGEQCWPAFVNPYSGEVRLGYLDPALIDTVVMDPDNAEQPVGIVAKRDRKGIQRRYRVIVNGPEDDLFTRRTAAIRQTFADGEAFFFKVNDLCTDSRGRSDLLPVMDWCDVYEQLLYGEAERQNAMRAYLWDVTLKNATADEVADRSKQIAPPAPGTVRVHNDAETWAAVSPDLQAADGAVGARLFRNHILSGQTLPEHWYGGGGDVNRSTGDSMSEPTLKILSLRQAYLGHMLLEAARFCLRQREKAVTGREPDLSDPVFKVECAWPEMSPKDTTQYAAALQQVVVACGMAMDKNLLSPDTALLVINAVSGRLGVGIDAEAELAKAQAEADRKAEQDAAMPPGLASPPPRTVQRHPVERGADERGD